MNGTRQVPCDVVIPAFGGSSHGDVLLLGPAERHQSHSAAAQLVRHHEPADPSSEDEDEDWDLLPTQEPFPSESVVLHEYTPL